MEVKLFIVLSLARNSLTSYELCTYHARARLVEVERLEKFMDKLIVKQ